MVLPRKKIIKFSQTYVLGKRFSDKFNKQNTKAMNDKKIDNDESNE